MSQFLKLFCLVLSLNWTLAQVPLPGKCPNIPAFPNLDVQRYGGDWYELERFFFLPQVTGSCVSVNYNPTRDGTLTTTIRLKEQVSGKKIAFPGVTQFLDPPLRNGNRIGNLQLTLDLVNPFVPQPRLQHTYGYKLADTDYNNYIIKFGCVSLIGVHFESVWILGRDQSYPPRVKALVRNSLERLGIDKNHLIRSTCSDPPARLEHGSVIFPE